MSSLFPPDKEPLSLNRVVAYLEKTDARDKVIKAFQNFLKYLVWHYVSWGQKEVAKKWKALATVLSEYRSLLKFGKPFKAIKDIIAVGSPGDLGDTLEIATGCCDIVYKVWDNFEFLSKYKVVGYDQDRMESISKTGQFWTYLTQFLIDLVEWRKIREKTKDAEGEKKMQKLRLDLVKDTSDLLRVLPPYLRRFSSFPTHDGFSAIMGTIAGASGAYGVWLKTK